MRKRKKLPEKCRHIGLEIELSSEIIQGMERLYQWDKATAIRCVKQCSDLVREHYKVRKIILYGSYARGAARIDSDIDVAVVLQSIEEDFLTCAARLFRLRQEIDARIEPVLLEESTEKSGFVEEISKTGEIIYNADQSA